MFLATGLIPGQQFYRGTPRLLITALIDSLVRKIELPMPGERFPPRLKPFDVWAIYGRPKGRPFHREGLVCYARQLELKRTARGRAVSILFPLRTEN